MEQARSFEDLLVWQKARLLVCKVYTATKSFPREELFGLISQMRRAAVSVVANIAEGFIKYSKKDKIHFYNIAQGSLNELRCLVILSNDLRYILEQESFLNQITEISKMLSGLINSIRRSSSSDFFPNY